MTRTIIDILLDQHRLIEHSCKLCNELRESYKGKEMPYAVYQPMAECLWSQYKDFTETLMIAYIYALIWRR